MPVLRIIVEYGLWQWGAEPDLAARQDHLAAVRRSAAEAPFAGDQEMIERLYIQLKHQRCVFLHYCCLLTAAAGAVLAAVGVMARRYLAHRGRVATLGVIIAGLVALMVSLYWAGSEDAYPPAWPRPTVLGGEPVPWPHLIMPFAGLAITLIAARVQMLVFLLVGLASVAVSVHLLGFQYFGETQRWPATIVVVGALCFAVALVRELQTSRGNAIDDVTSRRRL